MTRWCRTNMRAVCRAPCDFLRALWGGQGWVRETCRRASAWRWRWGRWGPRRSSSGSSWRRGPTSWVRRSRAGWRRCRTGCRLFPDAEARRIVESELARPLDQVFSAFGPPVAAASIAQVHEAETTDDPPRHVAVKILRPGIEAEFARDFEAFRLAADVAERFSAEARRLRLRTLVETLAASVALELDLRMEAAAASELAQNTRDDEDFRVPALDWSRTSARVFVSEWVDGVVLRDPETLQAAGHDPKRIAVAVLRVFPDAGAARRILPRRHASGKSVRRQRGAHLRRRFRHHGTARTGDAPLHGRNAGGLSRARLHARGPGAFRLRLRAEDPQCRNLRAGACARSANRSSG